MMSIWLFPPFWVIAHDIAVNIPAHASWFTCSEDFRAAHSSARNCWVLKNTAHSYEWNYYDDVWLHRTARLFFGVIVFHVLSRQHSISGPVAPRHLYHWILSEFLIFADPVCVNDVLLWCRSEQLFLSLLVTCISSVKGCSGHPVISFCWVICFIFSIYWSSSCILRINSVGCMHCIFS